MNVCVLCVVVPLGMSVHRERRRQKNFQLIIITHDVQFVELIGRSEFVDDYYLVKKAVG